MTHDLEEGDMYTVGALMEDLSDYDPDTPVMICTVKYPNEFALRRDESESGEWAWDNGSDVEVHPFEVGDLTQQRNMMYLVTELTEYDPIRAELGG